MSDYQRMLDEINYSMSKGVFIVNSKGCLIELKCPFFVIAKESIGSVVKGFKYNVLSVKMSVRYETVYEIKGGFYLYKSFDI